MQEQRRNRGFGRALLESIEEIARFLNIPRLMLCSTDDNDTKVCPASEDLQCHLPKKQTLQPSFPFLCAALSLQTLLWCSLDSPIRMLLASKSSAMCFLNS